MQRYIEKLKALRHKFYSIEAIHASWDQHEWAVIQRAITTGGWIDGPGLKTLSEKIRKKFNQKKVGLTNRGESALYSTLGDLPPGEVVIPSYCCGNVLIAVNRAGHTAVLADVRSDYNLGPDEIARVMSKKTRAIIVPSMYGKPAELFAIQKEFGDQTRIIDDAAQCFGAKHRGHWVGTFGDAGIFSLGAKTITSTAGGIVLSDPDSDVSKRGIEPIKSWPKQTQRKVMARLADSTLRYLYRKYSSPFLSVQYIMAKTLRTRPDTDYYQMANLDASLALAQWDKVGKINRQRIQNARVIRDELAGTEVMMPDDSREHVYSKCAIQLPGKSERRKKIWEPMRRFIGEMARRGIECEWCCTPLHLKEGIRQWKTETPVDLPESERLWWRTVAIPNHAGLNEEKAKEVASAVRHAIKKIT